MGALSRVAGAEYAERMQCVWRLMATDNYTTMLISFEFRWCATRRIIMSAAHVAASLEGRSAA